MEDRPSKRARVANGDDRLSDLPEELLHTVLSFLPIRQAVQTSVLSKRWRELWSTMPCIDIDQRQLAAGGAHAAAGVEARWLKLESFAYPMLLAHRATALDRFRVSVTDANPDKRLRHVVRWVHRGVESLEVEVQPWHIGRYLDLDLPAGSGGCYRRLRRLHLYGISLGRRFAETLRSWCPVLEDLELVLCRTMFDEITSATLKNLAVRGCDSTATGSGGAVVGRQLVITAPRLSSLQLANPASSFASAAVKEASSLAKAAVSLRPWETEAQRKILGCLFNVTSLVLVRLDAKMMLDERSYQLPVFHNLKRLSLKYCFIDQDCSLNNRFRALGKFLQHTSHLENLTLQHCMISERLKRGEHYGKTNTADIPDPNGFNALQCQNLKAIEIEYRYQRERQISEHLRDIWTNKEMVVVFTRTTSHGTLYLYY